MLSFFGSQPGLQGLSTWQAVSTAGALWWQLGCTHGTCLQQARAVAEQDGAKPTYDLCRQSWARQVMAHTQIPCHLVSYQS